MPMNEQRFYHTCGQAIWRMDDPGRPISFGYQLEGEIIPITRCPRCQTELAADSLQKASGHPTPAEQTPLTSTSASLHSLAGQLVEAAEQLEDRAGTMRGRADQLRQQGDQID
jgi:hypothetical protein